jgi:4-aminobutyrate aminotransferase
MGLEDLEQAYPEYFSPALAKATHLLVERGEGPYLFTTRGEKYIDFVQGIAVNALGHAHPAIVNAMELVKEKKRPDPDKARFIQTYLQQKKILVLTCGPFKNVIRFIPPLNVEDGLLEVVLTAVEEALKESHREMKPT